MDACRLQGHILEISYLLPMNGGKGKFKLDGSDLRGSRMERGFGTWIWVRANTVLPSSIIKRKTYEASRAVCPLLRVNKKFEDFQCLLVGSGNVDRKRISRIQGIGLYSQKAFMFRITKPGTVIEDRDMASRIFSAKEIFLAPVDPRSFSAPD